MEPSECGSGDYHTAGQHTRQRAAQGVGLPLGPGHHRGVHRSLLCTGPALDDCRHCALAQPRSLP
eukprot:3581839-Pyramimonas_sp.AAC.1